MNTVESLYMEMPFTVTESKQTVVNKSKDKNSYHEKDGQLAINNYLKTPEEIDAELSSAINTRMETFAKHQFLMDSYGRIFKNRSDNAYSPDNNPSGFMEENY